MKTRPIKELLEIMLNNFDQYFNLGLCRLAGRLEEIDEINEKELSIIIDYLEDNVPDGIDSSYFWWDEGVKQPRIKYLEYHIRKLELEEDPNLKYLTNDPLT